MFVRNKSNIKIFLTSCIQYFIWKPPFFVSYKHNLFLTNTHLLASQDVNWWTGVVWITLNYYCKLLWCFYQLFGLSFWRHPFTAEDPLVSKWCNVTFLQICSHEETNSPTSWMAWVWVHFQQMDIFLGTIPLITVHKYKIDVALYIWC